MPVAPFYAWVITYAACNAALFLIPAFRPLFLGVALLHVAVLVWGITNIRSQFFGKVLFRAAGATKKCALTFDDGPDPGLTSAIVDLLNAYGFKATFFAIGNKARSYPAIVKKAFDAGHCIGCHDLTHAVTSNFRMTESLILDISAAQRIIYTIIGKTPLLYRPPVGLMNPHVPIALTRLNMTCIGWNRRVRDAGNRRIKTLVGLPALAKPGSVILLHDCLPKPEMKPVFLAQLEKLLQTIKEKGLEPVRVDELFEVKAYG